MTRAPTSCHRHRAMNGMAGARLRRPRRWVSKNLLPKNPVVCFPSGNTKGLRIGHLFQGFDFTPRLVMVINLVAAVLAKQM